MSRRGRGDGGGGRTPDGIERDWSLYCIATRDLKYFNFCSEISVFLQK